MTDQPNPGSQGPGPAPGAASEPPALAPLVDPQPGWAPAGDQAAPSAPVAAQPPKATRSDKLRLGLILGAIVAFIAIVLVATMNNQSAGDLAIGQCFDLPGRTEDISTVEKHACTEAHDAEVFHVTNYDGTTYPILGVEDFVDTACMPVFATYVGKPFEDANEYNVGWFYPNREGWDRGDREVTCYVIKSDNSKLTQSVKAAASSAAEPRS